ncbi:MAG: L-2-amino-thiazoline-4-carboxylic acid hydrolase, partial [Anaerolineaceae bacterium]
NRIMQPLVRHPLVIDKGEKWLPQLLEEVREEFIWLILEIPFSGYKNIWKMNLVAATAFLAFYNVLKDKGWMAEEIGQIIQLIVETFCNAFPSWMRRLAGRRQFSLGMMRKLLNGAVQSQLRQYDGDWVYKVIPGDNDFDYGVDIYHCAIVKFFQTHDAQELTPFLCSIDHFMAQAMGYQFKRNGELANGASCCDCRYIHGRGKNV